MSKEELETMFGLDDLRQTRYFQDVELEASRKTRREDILKVLSVRFSQIPLDVTSMLNSIVDMNVLQELFNQALSVKKMAEFQRLLKKAARTKDED